MTEKQYKVIFRYKKYPKLGGELIYDNKKLFSYEDAVKIADQENNCPKATTYEHIVEEA
tara:strand:- start:158 stop:334 length:177 start_codon:yes stop_codon:yes gene_type:complete